MMIINRQQFNSVEERPKISMLNLQLKPKNFHFTKFLNNPFVGDRNKHTTTTHYKIVFKSKNLILIFPENDS